MLDRPLPESERAEKGVLCCMMFKPLAVMDEVIQQKITAKYFHHPCRGIIFSSLMEMNSQGVKIDLLTITQYMEDKGLLTEVGGVSAITEIFSFDANVHIFPEYLDILREKYILRELAIAAIDVANMAYENEMEASLVLSKAEERISSITEPVLPPEETTQAIALQALDEIERLYNSHGALTGLSTGIKSIDDITNGLHKTEMIVIAGRPSMGKTALAMNIAEYVAVDLNIPTQVYSLEMSRQQLMGRLIHSRSGIDSGKVRKGFLSKHEFPRLTTATAEIGESPLYLCDTPAITIQQLKSHARRAKDKKKIELIVIDYLQLMRSPSKKGNDNRQVEVAEISSGIKALAKELELPIIVLAQLNRAPDSRSGGDSKRPRLSDLRESGAIEQDADVVGLTYRPEYYAKDEEERQKLSGIAELIIAKNRNGVVDTVHLEFINNITRFQDRND